MSVMLTWLADALRAEGCRVSEQSGWKTYGRPGAFDPDGPGWHHTGTTTSAGNTHPTLNTCINGRSDLEGPLCQVMIGYDGVCYVIAAGRANHGGACNGWGPYTSSRDANDQIVGFEIDYDGTQPMSAAQKDAATRASAAVLKRLKHDASWATRHEEWSTTGKWDTGGLTGDQIRSLIKDYMADAPAEGGFVDFVKLASSTRQTIKQCADGAWAELRLADDSDDAPAKWGAVKGPAHFLIDVALTTESGIALNEPIMFQGFNSGGDMDDVTATHPIQQVAATDGGPQHFVYRFQGSVKEGEWARVRVQSDVQFVITKAETTATVW
jgi:hypothetical protein